MKQIVLIIISIIILTNAQSYNGLDTSKNSTEIFLISNTYPIINCTTIGSRINCSNHGICNIKYKCLCDNDYTTFHSNIECNYKKTSRLTSFLLQLFLGYGGVSKLYMGYKYIASGQIIFFCSSITICCFLKIFVSCIISKSKKQVSKINIIKTLIVWANIAWWIYDCIMIGNGNRKNSDGIETDNSM